MAGTITTYEHFSSGTITPSSQSFSVTYSDLPPGVLVYIFVTGTQDDIATLTIKDGNNADLLAGAFTANSDPSAGFYVTMTDTGGTIHAGGDVTIAGTTAADDDTFTIHFYLKR